MVPMLMWIFSIRPYCHRNGKGYTAGASWQTTMWIDWQEAKETATEKGDGGMVWCCRIYLIGVLLFTVSIFLSIVSAIL